ncbi:uncharacterized protein BCR38DRAFT_413289 [Pseudomassariella vexata]|uniref:Uncharacterized protein n=1 Tax=Pseudomassariella vexata TaxID=1141098 RepID=A0A1Y2DGL4_9PEZI|nr:uncharacterized protein BCR38DRAFT_413289 [Pseudomassariella vexata]ORY58421.1 hypothetical protein BCR38DRAFT_413289 [Pseudomassariella vexata]
MTVNNILSYVANASTSAPTSAAPPGPPPQPNSTTPTAFISTSDHERFKTRQSIHSPNEDYISSQYSYQAPNNVNPTDDTHEYRNQWTGAAIPADLAMRDSFTPSYKRQGSCDVLTPPATSRTDARANILTTLRPRGEAEVVRVGMEGLLQMRVRWKIAKKDEGKKVMPPLMTLSHRP